MPEDTTIPTVQCPQCDAIFGLDDSGEPQDGICPGCGTWLCVDRQPDGTYKAWR